jgi:geranylgeranyl diphosphate synthase type II
VIDVGKYIGERKAWVDRSLNALIPGAGRNPALLHEAERYSLFAGGKRIRPVLALAAYEALARPGGSARLRVKKAVPVVSAIELIHTYSLVHDDLPAMDNDDFRRGRPTSHKKFGEPVAILVGDSLLTEAFRLLSDPRVASAFPPATMLRVTHELAEGSGSLGMAGGQLMDIQALSRGGGVDEKTVRSIHVHKTGALIRASIRIGAILGNASPRALSDLTRYGEKAGLAFQIADDILDVEGDPERMGKGVRKDQAAHKLTYPGAVGLEKAKAVNRRLLKEALAALSRFDRRADPLRALARFVIERSH